MSLPYPNTSTGMPKMDPKVLAAMDAPLIDLTNKCGGDLRQLLFAFFSFLHRRTDFYVVPNEQDLREGLPVQMGFREGDAEKLLLAAFRQFPLRRMPLKATRGDRKDTKAAAGSCLKQPKMQAPESQSSTSRTDGTSEATTTPNEETAAAPADRVAKKQDQQQKVDEVRFTEEGLQVPVGNGGTTKRYTWTQTMDETTVLVPVPEDTKGRDLVVSLKPSSISVRMKTTAKGQDDNSSTSTLLDGDLVGTIRTDESTWSLEGGVLVLILDKLKKTWWETVLIGDDKIDTTLVDARRRIDEYDRSTQAAIRKILFDQRQERLGLPTSDEIAGTTPPTLPKGVEYIDQSTLDKQPKGGDAS